MEKTNRTKLIAHRGLSGTYLENTKPAFSCAGKNKYVDAIECDVRFSLDHKAVTFHDEHLKRLNGNKIYVRETPYLLLTKYRLFDKKSGVFDMGYSICRFVTYLKICKKYKKIAIVEIKQANEYQLDLLIKTIKRHKYMDSVVFISNLPKVLLYIRKRLPYVELQYIIKNPIKSKLMFCIKNKINLSIYYKFLKSETVETFHKYDLKVSVWTVNTLEQVKHFLSMGVDYITSNYAFDLKTLK